MGLHAAIIRLTPLIHEGEQRVSSLCDPPFEKSWLRPWIWWRKIQSEIEGYNPLLTSNAYSVTVLFQNKVMFLLKIMLIYNEALLSGQPSLSGHLPVTRGWPLNWGSTVLLGTLQKYDGDVNGIVKKSISFNEHNNNFARASRLFVNFIQLQMWQGRILRSLENGSRGRR